jgi:hypothetical protein
MKTAVEWLEEKWRNYDLNLGKSGFSLLLKQAQEMEKQQMTEAWKEGYDLAINGERIPKL